MIIDHDNFARGCMGVYFLYVFAKCNCICICIFLLYLIVVVVVVIKPLSSFSLLPLLHNYILMFER